MVISSAESNVSHSLFVRGQQFCTFYLDKYFFGVPVEKVQEVMRFQKMTRVPLAPRVVAGLINLRGQIVTAMDLRRCLDMPDRSEDKKPMNVVLRSSKGAVSLLVDEIADVVEALDDTFERPPDTLKGAARDMIPGVFKLKDRLMLVLDIDKVLDLRMEAAA